MKKNNHNKHFRVFKNETTVKEISTNDFQPLKLKPLKENWLIGNTTEIYCAINAVKYSLPENSPLFCDYNTQAIAMEMAKAGALKYINSLIDQGRSALRTLLQYRMDHYEDLHFNLVEANIQQVDDDASATQEEG